MSYVAQEDKYLDSQPQQTHSNYEFFDNKLSVNKYLMLQANSPNHLSNRGPDSESNHSLFLIKYKKNEENYNGQTSNPKLGNQFQKKQEIYSLFMFIFFLLLTIITLSQILVMHNQTHNSNFKQIKQMQEELTLMDATIDTMLREKKVLPMQVWYAIKQYNENLKRFAVFIDGITFTDYSGFALNLDNSNQADWSPKINSFMNHDTLISILNQCEKFTDQHLIINSNNGQSSVQIYKHLVDSLNQSNSTNIHKTSENIKEFSDVLNNILESSLKNIAFLETSFKDSPSMQSIQRTCMKSITLSLFNLFSEEYTNYFETEPELRELLVDRYSSINNTLSQFIKSDTSSDIKVPRNDYFLKMPLRNMNDLYKRYKMSQNKFNTTNQTMCSEQPPNLCKWFSVN